MKNVHVAENVLSYLDIAVLRRIEPGQYELLGKPPSFYNVFFPPSSGESCSSPWLHSHMLSFFYEMAEDFFSKGDAGTISSGIWEEENLCCDEQALEAEAITFNNAQVIIIRLLRDLYKERTLILRKAREQLLEQRLLSSDLEKYKNKSRIDGLTKVLNRAAFMELLPLHFTHAQETGTHFSIIMLDIDHFKMVNDTYGHQAGDMVLSTLGDILISRLRRDDIVARYGGEEFIIIAPSTPMERALRIAEKLRKNVAERHFGDLPRITISLGCAVHQAGDTPDELIRRADQALYEAKNNGRDMVRGR